MTTSPNPNHADEARGLIDAVHDWQEREGETDATMLAAVLEAQTEATFALEAQTARLADEARTANLLAMARLAFGDGQADLTQPWDGSHDTHEWSAIRDQIAARLDLTQDVTP